MKAKSPFPAREETNTKCLARDQCRSLRSGLANDTFFAQTSNLTKQSSGECRLQWHLMQESTMNNSGRVCTLKSYGLTAALGLVFFLFHFNPAVALDGGNASVLPLIKFTDVIDGHWLYIRLVGLGQRKVDVPLIFDTGHSGISVDCRALLGYELCTKEGIKTDNEMLVDGIRITAKKVSQRFEKVIEYAQIAYARVSFGSSESPVSTSKEIPFLLRYKEEDRATGKTIVTGHMGVFGVSPIDATSSGIWYKSPLASVKIGPSLSKGFYLSPIGANWVACYNHMSNCPLTMSLHIGIDDSIKKEFKLTKIKRLSNRYTFATVKACVAFQKQSVCKQTLFDTGSPKSIVSQKPQNSSSPFLRAGERATLSGPAVGEWRFETKSNGEILLTDAIEFNVIGIHYFEKNSLLFDLETGQIGFRIGR